MLVDEYINKSILPPPFIILTYPIKFILHCCCFLKSTRKIGVADLKFLSKDYDDFYYKIIEKKQHYKCILRFYKNKHFKLSNKTILFKILSSCIIK